MQPCGAPVFIMKGVVDEVDERRWEEETVKFASNQMSLNGVESRTEINEIHPGKVSGSVQIGRDMQQHPLSPLFLICKLVWIQV